MDQTTPKDLIKITTDQTVTTSTTQTSQPKQVILDEDSYTEAISEIIKRDFFPSLITLEAQNDYVDALGTNDPDVIREATIKLNNLTTPANKTPVATPRIPPSETPLTSRQIGEWDTPASTTSRSTNLFKAHESLEKNYDTNMSLDSFQTKYTSEDNASFSELMHKANEQRKQKYKWLYEKEQLSIENNSNDSIKLIEGSNQEKPAEISTWKYKVRNSLMFYPEGHQTQNIEDHSRAPPKKIVHDATRFESAEEMSINNHAAAIAAAAAGGGLNLDSSIRSASQTPRVGGYSFVPATPSPNPSQIDSSELMTWGMVEGTPLLIGGDQTPGPAFHLPPTSRREIIGMELSSNASRNMRKRNLSLKSPRITSITQSPFSNKISSPRIRATLLSPAARSLLRKSHRLSSTKSNQQR